jgi:hypothetical protein
LIFPNAAKPAVCEDISPQCIGITDGRSKPIRRAINAATATIQNVRVDHCRAHVFVAQEFLNCANIVTVFKQVSSERNDENCGTWPVWISLPFAQRLSRPSVKPIHEDGVSSLRRLPDQHKVLTQERPTASPIM